VDNNVQPNKFKPLVISLSLTLSFFFIEAIGGFIIGSLALIADAAHMLTDVTALSVAIVAIKLAQKPANKIKTYGYYRFEILAVAFNASLLFILSFYIVYEAYQRINNPPTIQSIYMLIIASIGLLINIVSILLLRADKDVSINIKAAYINVLGDMLGSIGVIIGAVIIYFFNWVWIDAFIGILIGLWLLPRAWMLLKESLNILLEGVPYGIDIDSIKKDVLAIKGVIDIHDLHVWAITSDKISLTAHVVVEVGYEATDVTAEMRVLLQNKYNISHCTLQSERKNCSTENEECYFF